MEGPELGGRTVAVEGCRLTGSTLTQPLVFYRRGPPDGPGSIMERDVPESRAGRKHVGCTA